MTTSAHVTRRRGKLARWWVNLPIAYKGLLVITLPVLGVVLTIVLRIPFAAQQQETTALLTRASEIRDRTQDIVVALLDVETGARGYLLTGYEGFQLQFENGRKALPQALSALGQLVSDDERPLFDRAADHANHRAAYSDDLIRQRVGGHEATDPAIARRLIESKQEMDEARAALAQLLTAEHDVVTRNQQELERIRQRTAPFIWLAFLGGFVGAAAAMWLFATGIVRRMAAVERNAERLAKGERLPYEPSRGGDEIGRVDRALRRAAITIRERNRELASLNASLERSLHEQQILNRELEAFSYSVSHDLRAPLRSIDGFAQALREDWGDRLDESGQDHLARVRNAAQRMGRLIDDLLKLSRLSRAQIQRVDVDLSQIARDIAGEQGERNPTRNVRWEIQDGLHAHCDPSLARIVLENLLGNAWKFTSKTPDACIEFSAIPDTRPTTFVVRDNGAGFDMKYAEKLFAPFQRLHGEREFPGTGIGLATVQRIVHKHGGEVRTRAEVNGGASFYFSLEPADGAVAA